MGFLDRLFGRSEQPRGMARSSGRPRGGRAALSEDEQALERYRYLLRTAPPETIEEAHAEAFAQLTPEQRRTVLNELSTDLPAGERAAAMNAEDDPRALARVATRAEMRQPGAMERSLGRMSPAGGIGFGGMMASSMMGTIAGVVVGSAIANAFFADSGNDGGGGDTGGDAGTDGGEAADAGFDSGDAGGDVGSDFGGDFGGGDFGGGDFGGDF